MDAFLVSFLLIAIAEMGDKTQLMSMAFASRYSPGKVLLGVAIASLLNNVIAVTAGRFLQKFIPMDFLSIIVSISFILFGIWLLHEETLGKKKENKKSRFGPVMTVGITFFLAEIGDKTQLATMAMAMKYNAPFAVLAGSTAGMITANILGISAGVLLKKKFSIRIIKALCSAIFVFFGLLGIFSILYTKVSLSFALSVFLPLALYTLYATRLLREQAKQEKESLNKE